MRELRNVGLLLKDRLVLSMTSYVISNVNGHILSWPDADGVEPVPEVYDWDGDYDCDWDWVKDDRCLTKGKSTEGQIDLDNRKALN